MKILNIISLLISLIILISGCASTGGSYKAIDAPIADQRRAQFTELQFKIQSGNDISLKQESIDRMTKLVIENVRADVNNHFNNINSELPSASTLEAVAIIKKYEEGNAFARAMLAGLGQIRIDADIILYDYASKTKLTQYEINKTFAWGGAYGALTSIKDVEIGFSKAVADSILGKK